MEHTFQSALQVFPHGVLLVEDGWIVFANQVASDLCGIHIGVHRRMHITTMLDMEAISDRLLWQHIERTEAWHGYVRFAETDLVCQILPIETNTVAVFCQPMGRTDFRDAVYQTLLLHELSAFSTVDREGIVTFAEGRGLDALPFAARDTVGQSLYALYHHHPQVLAAFLSALQGQHAKIRASIGNAAFDVFYAPIKDAHHTIIGVAGAAFHVSQQYEQVGAALILQLAENVLLLPLTGTLDPVQVHHIIESIMVAISHSQSAIVIVDRSRVDASYTYAAHAIALIAQVATEAGCQVILSGVPSLAQSVGSDSVETDSIRTSLTLQEAVTWAFQQGM